MRRMFKNSTALAACLSLLVPPLAQAQAPAEGERPPVPPAQAQPAEPQAQQADPAEEPEAEEPAAEEPAAEAAPAEEPAEEPAPEPAAAAPEAAPAEPEAEREASERPAQAQREQESDRPARAESRETESSQEEAPAAAEDPADAAAAEAEPAEAPAVSDERPAEANREQEQERPVEAAREQQADRPVPAPDAEAEAGTDAEADTGADAGTEAGSEDALRDALEAEEAGTVAAEPAEAAAEAAPEDAPAGAQGEDAPREALEQEQQDQAPASAEQPANQAAARGNATTPPEADAPRSEAARQAAEETGSAAVAAALDEGEQGEVVEEEITEENSRSSSEDFQTSLREALTAGQGQAAAQNQEARRDDDGDDDDNNLARALLLGLGAVAVGSYLNNNRQVTLSTPDRVVVTRPDGSQEIIKDEVALLRQPGSTVTTENFDDGSSRTVVTRSDGSRVVTIRDADLRVLRRTLISPDGTQTRLIDDTATVEPVDVASLPAPAPTLSAADYRDEAALREALRREVDLDRRFTLGQIRSIPEVRALVPPVTVDAITFDTGSAAISPDQARQLSTLGKVIADAIAQNPREIFLIEGHTDTVGPDAANLALSDRRAESVALALTEYFDVPPENLVVQGYGEQFLQVRREGDVRENRRAAVRRITDLLQTAEAN